MSEIILETLRISKIKLREDGILHIDIKPNEIFTASDVREVVSAAGLIGGGEKFANLITVGQFTTPDKEAREMASSEEWCKYKLADAFVISSFAQVMVANFYIKYNKPCRPTKYFLSESEALVWLSTLKK
jgi:hypothetical protein